MDDQRFSFIQPALMSVLSNCSVFLKLVGTVQYSAAVKIGLRRREKRRAVWCLVCPVSLSIPSKRAGESTVIIVIFQMHTHDQCEFLLSTQYHINVLLTVNPTLDFFLFVCVNCYLPAAYGSSYFLLLTGYLLSCVNVRIDIVSPCCTITICFLMWADFNDELLLSE